MDRVVQLFRRDAQLTGVRPDVGEGDLRGLLHHVAELAGHGQPALVAGQQGRLDVEHVAAHPGHGQAGGDAGNSRTLRGLRGEPGTPDQVLQVGGLDRGGQLTQRGFAERFCEQALHRPYARLSGVIGGDLAQGVLGDRHLSLGQGGLLQLPRHEEVPGDGDLVVLGVAVDADQLHPVEQRLRNRLQGVRRGDEEHVGQVQVEVQVVVAERVVLRRVQHLQQRRGRVAPVVAADLVDLVEQDDRVHRARFPDGSDDASGKSAHIGTAVAADLRLVTHAAQGDPDELAAEGARHGLAERGLADSGRTGQQDHRARATPADDGQATGLAAGPNAQVLHDAVLDLVEAVVVGVEHGAGRDQVGVVGGPDTPRQVEDGVEPGADPAGLGVLIPGALQLVDLAQRRLTDGVGQRGPLDLGAVVVGAVRLALAELLADRLELLAQQVLAVALLDRLPDIGLDLVADLGLGQEIAGPLDEQLQPRLDIRGLQQLTLAVTGQVRRPARGVGQVTGVVDGADRVDDLPRLAALQNRDDQLLVLGGQLTGRVTRLAGFDGLRLDPQRGAGTGHTTADLGAYADPQHGRGRATAQLADLLDRGDHAVGGVTVLEPRRDQQLGTGRGTGGVDGRPGFLIQLDGHDHAGEQHDVVEEQHRETLAGHRVPPKS